VKFGGEKKIHQLRGRTPAARQCVGRAARAATRSHVDSIHLSDWRVAATQGDSPRAAPTREHTELACQAGIGALPATQPESPGLPRCLPDRGHKQAATRPGTTAKLEPTCHGRPGGGDPLPAAQLERRVLPAVNPDRGLKRVAPRPSPGATATREYTRSPSRGEERLILGDLTRVAESFPRPTRARTHAGRHLPQSNGDSATHRSPSWGGGRPAPGGPELTAEPAPLSAQLLS
jgi:hypothetical protein